MKQQTVARLGSEWERSSDGSGQQRQQLSPVTRAPQDMQRTGQPTTQDRARCSQWQHGANRAAANLPGLVMPLCHRCVCACGSVCMWVGVQACAAGFMQMPGFLCFCAPRVSTEHKSKLLACIVRTHRCVRRTGSLLQPVKI